MSNGIESVEKPESRERRQALFYLRLTIGLLILIAALSQVDWREVLDVFKGVNLVPILVVYFIWMVVAVVNACRFKVVAEEPRKNIPIYFALHLIFKGFFSNIVMPARSGGDLVRIYHTRRIIPLPGLILSLFVDRLAGLLMIYLLAAMGLFLFAPPMSYWFWQMFAMVSAFVAGLVAILFFPFPGRLALRIADRFRFTKMPDFIRNISSGRNIFRAYKEKLSRLIPLIIASHLLGVIMFWLLSKSLNMNLLFSDFFWISPVLSIALLVPLSVSDLGVQEGVLAYLMGFLGVEFSAAIALAILYRVVQTSFSLVTGLAWLRAVKYPPAATTDTPGDPVPQNI